eukprot:1137485-Pelagomonas_calceolata.AAC.3
MKQGSKSLHRGQVCGCGDCAGQCEVTRRTVVCPLRTRVCSMHKSKAVNRMHRVFRGCTGCAERPDTWCPSMPT